MKKIQELLDDDDLQVSSNVGDELQCMDQFIHEKVTKIEEQLDRLNFDNGLAVSQKLINEVRKEVDKILGELY